MAVTIKNPLIIKGGGGEPEPTGDYRVRFYDFDGSYEDRFCNSGESVTPPDWSNKHQYLTFVAYQGDAYTNVTNNRKTYATYKTNGNHYFFIDNTPVTTTTSYHILGTLISGTLIVKLDGQVVFSTSTPEESYEVLNIPRGKHVIEFSCSGLFEGGINGSILGDGDRSRTIKKIYLGNDHIRYTALGLFYMTALESILISTEVPQELHNFLFSAEQIRHITFPNHITSITSSSAMNAFRLETVKLPDSLNHMENILRNAHSLKTINVPASFATMANYSWSGSNANDREYIFHSTTPMTLPRSALNYFFNSLSFYMRIYVPDSSVNAYKTATNWTTVANYIYPISQRPSEV